jgi:hypothetical protein
MVTLFVFIVDVKAIDDRRQGCPSKLKIYFRALIRLWMNL